MHCIIYIHIYPHLSQDHRRYDFLPFGSWLLPHMGLLSWLGTTPGFCHWGLCLGIYILLYIYLTQEKGDLLQHGGTCYIAPTRGDESDVKKRKAVLSSQFIIFLRLSIVFDKIYFKEVKIDEYWIATSNFLWRFLLLV